LIFDWGNAADPLMTIITTMQLRSLLVEGVADARG